MRFIYHVIQATPRDRQFPFWGCYKSAVVRLRGKKMAHKTSWASHFSHFAKMMVLLWSIPFRLRRRKQAKVILYNCGNNADLRKYFYQKFNSVPHADEEILTLGNEGVFEPLYFSRLSIKAVFRTFFAAWIIFRASFFALWGRSRIYSHWKIRFANMLLQQVLFFDESNDQMHFISFEPETYLSAMVACCIIPEYKPKLSSSNSIWFVNNRYLINPRIDLKICSSFQLVETDFYKKAGWMKVGSSEVWGLEEVMLYDRVEPRLPTYDVAVYSSGAWARTHDLWRSSDLEKLRAGGYPDNPLYLKTRFILDAVCSLKEKYSIKAKFYFHPHEISLMKQHGIKSPLLPFLEANDIHYSYDQNSSIETVYEAKVGVGTMSTILFDRLHLGLQSLWYEGQDMPELTMFLDSLGKYVELAFSNEEELKSKILNQLGLQADK